MVTILRTPFINGLKELKHDQQHQANRDHDHEGHSHGVRPEAEAILQLVLNRQMDPLDAVNATLGTTLSELRSDRQRPETGDQVERRLRPDCG